MNDQFREPGSGSLRGVLQQIPHPQDLDEQPHRQMPYAPPAPAPSLDTIQVAGLTIKSVHRVGTESAAEIDEIADTIEKAGKETANKLRELSMAVRHYHVEAARAVENFCQRAASVLEGARTLHDEFHKQQEPPDDQNL